MRPVKEIVTEFGRNGATIEALNTVINELVLHDIPELKRQRRAQTDEAILAILNTVEERFGAFANKAPALADGRKLQPNHFDLILKATYPEIHDLWQIGKMLKGRQLVRR
ncbi:MAG: hypothetical protein WC250_03740 [Candidatus Paceibacterota bacterium]|jgi:hypothetical protein